LESLAFDLSYRLLHYALHRIEQVVLLAGVDELARAGKVELAADPCKQLSGVLAKTKSHVEFLLVVALGP